MIFSIILSILGIILAIKLKDKLGTNIFKIILVIFIFSIILTGMDFIGNVTFNRKIIRPSDKGKIFNLNFKVGKIKKNIDIYVKGRNPTEKEKKNLIKKAKKEIDKTILLKNSSLDKVRTKLKLKTYYQKEKVRVEWNIKSKLVLPTGEVKNGRLKKPKTINLEAILSCKGYKEIYSFPIRILPANVKNEEELDEIIDETVEHLDKESIDKDFFYLPKNIGNNSIKWKFKTKNRGFIISIMGILILLLYPFIEVEKKKKEEKERQDSLSKDYPKIVERLSLYVCSGMSERSAMKEISKTYKNFSKKEKKKHEGFYLINSASNDMESGTAEIEAYRRIGKRGKHKDFRKLSLMLSENIRRGTGRMIELLENEAIEAENREMNNLKKEGEMISTKLMFPLMGMLLVILVILLVPAMVGISI